MNQPPKKLAESPSGDLKDHTDILLERNATAGTGNKKIKKKLPTLQFSDDSDDSPEPDIKDDSGEDLSPPKPPEKVKK